MGQRSQMILSLPAIYYNENNPNNRPRRLFILHSQWLYGSGFLQFLDDFVKGVKEIYDPKYIDASVTQVINWACKHRLNSPVRMENIDNPSEVFSGSECEHAFTGGLAGFVNFLDKHTDNNNGYMVIHIREDGEVDFEVFTGTEDANAILPVSPMEYALQFYSKDDLADAKFDFVRTLDEQYTSWLKNNPSGIIMLLANAHSRLRNG